MSRPSQRDDDSPAAPSPLSVIGGGYLATMALGPRVAVASADQPARSAAETGHTTCAQADPG